MNERERAEQFKADLDRLLEEEKIPGSETQPEEYQQLIAVASHLSKADASQESKFRALLEKRLRAKAKRELPQSKQKKNQLTALGTIRVGAGILFLALFVLGLNWVFSHLRPSTSGSGQKEPTSPASTQQETLPALLPTSLSEDIPSPLSNFPISVGSQWVYSFVEHQQADSDPNQIITITATITETIVSTQQVGDLFLAQVDRHRQYIDTPAGWASPTIDSVSYWYVVAGQKVYVSPNPPENTQNFTDTLPLQYDFPLILGKSWCPTKDKDCLYAGKQSVTEQDVYATPAGKFTDCFDIHQEAEGGEMYQWFCNGIGMVASETDNAASRAQQVLVKYNLGRRPTTPKEPTPTVAPTSAPLNSRLSLDQLKNMQYCQPTYCWADMKDGKFGNGDKGGELIEPVAFGDLNSDSWQDAAVLIREDAFGTITYDLVAVLNINGQPEKTIEKTLPNDATVQSIQIENGQIVLSSTTSSSTNEPESTYKGITQTFELAGQTLTQVRLVSQTQDGKTHTLTLEQPASAVITSSSLLIPGKLSVTHKNMKLIYNLYDQDGNQVYNAESSATVSPAGDFIVSVDLGWVEPDKLRLEVVDFYSSSNLGEDLASNSVNIDFQPADRIIPPALFTYFHMIDEQTGWAQSAQTAVLLHTNDGGLTWQKTNLPYNGLFALDILDSNSAWLLGQDPSQSQQVLFHTNDGGQTWNKLPDLPSQFGGLIFLDAQHGFFEDHPGGYYMMGQTRFILYSTQDGGQTWEKVFDNTPGSAQQDQDPTRGHMVFRDMQNGWVVDSVIGTVANNSLYLMRTKDGGRTWTDVSQSLPMPDVPQETFLSQREMKFFGSDQAVMPLVIQPTKGDPNSIRLYISKDGGESWTLTSPEATQSNNPTIDILSADTIMVWDGVSEHVTNDGGQTWTSQKLNMNFSGSLSSLQFVTPTIGFALVNDHNMNVQNTALYKTTDSGQTWEKIDVK